MHIHLHRGAVLPARSDLIASSLLKPEHICLVIIKSWGGGRTEAQTCRHCEHPQPRDGVIAAAAVLGLGTGREGLNLTPEHLPGSAPLPQANGTSPGVPGLGVTLQCTERESGQRLGLNMSPNAHLRMPAGR